MVGNCPKWHAYSMEVHLGSTCYKDWVSASLQHCPSSAQKCPDFSELQCHEEEPAVRTLCWTLATDSWGADGTHGWCRLDNKIDNKEMDWHRASKENGGKRTGEKKWNEGTREIPNSNSYRENQDTKWEFDPSEGTHQDPSVDIRRGMAGVSTCLLSIQENSEGLVRLVTFPVYEQLTSWF